MKIPKVKVTCAVCKSKLEVKPSRAKTFKTCSKSCFAKFTTGHPPYHYKGGRMMHKGYVLILTKGHPRGDRDGYVYEHRLVMEKHLGRYLTSEEVVDHKNGVRNDNRIENLTLFPSHSAHMKNHYPKGHGVGDIVYSSSLS